jgi:hypothetical protein
MDTRCVDISVEPTREYVCAGLPAPQGATRSVSTHHSSLRASCLGELARFLSVELSSVRLSGICATFAMRVVGRSTEKP